MITRRTNNAPKGFSARVLVFDAGLARARREGQKLGRKRQRVSRRDLDRVAGLSVREAAKALGIPPSRVYSERRRA